jgi:hypothetical protein
MQQSSYVGIDVSKHHLDVAFPGVPKVWRTPNDASGIAALVRRVRRLGNPHVVCEATGGYTRRLTVDLAVEAITLSRVNPRQVRDFTVEYEGVEVLYCWQPGGRHPVADRGCMAMGCFGTQQVRQDFHGRAVALQPGGHRPVKGTGHALEAKTPPWPSSSHAAAWRPRRLS